MKNSQLRASILFALECPDYTVTLQRWLAWRLPRLARVVRVPRSAPLAELELFARAYIRRSPDYHSTVEQLTATLGVTALASPLLELASDWLRQTAAPQDTRAKSPALLVDLLHMAYMAHRLLEEINDYCVAASGGPQIPYGMTVATLICHDLIGEPFAHELDAAVASVVEQCLAGQPLPQLERRFRRTRVDWPCPPDNLALTGFSRSDRLSH